jgi:hypothetical protein
MNSEGSGWLKTISAHAAGFWLLKEDWKGLSDQRVGYNYGIARSRRTAPLGRRTVATQNGEKELTEVRSHVLTPLYQSIHGPD